MKKVLIGLFAAVLAQTAFADKPTLTVYTYDSFVSEWGPGPQLKTQFEQTCDCELNFVGLADGVSILNRLKLEKEKTKADVVLGLDNNLIAEAQATNMLVEHSTDLSQLSVPNGWDDKTFVPFDWGYFAFIYNSEKITTPPKSLNELVESDLTVLYQDPRTSTPGLGLMLWMQKVFGEKAGEKFAKLTEHTVTVTPDWWGAYEMFTNGEADVVLSYSTSPAYHVVAEEVTKYKAAAFSEGHYQQIEVAAKVKTSQQLELAQQFLDYLVSKPAQEIIPVTNWMMPVRSDVELPEAFSQVIDVKETLLFKPQTVAQMRKAWVNQWLENTAK